MLANSWATKSSNKILASQIFGRASLGWTKHILSKMSYLYWHVTYLGPVRILSTPKHRSRSGRSYRLFQRSGPKRASQNLWSWAEQRGAEQVLRYQPGNTNQNANTTILSSQI
jgi:hypothetical protein